MKTISIVTPSYNQGQFLEETIRSVLSQEGDFFIEYIIRDGGSKDRSVDIIKEYDQLLRNGSYPVRCKGITFRWVSEQDGGQVDALNKGFQQASGDIMAWLNSDDYYFSPKVLSEVLEAFQTHQDRSVFCGRGYIVDKSSKRCGESPFIPYDRDLLRRKNYIFQPSVFFAKKVFQDIGPLNLEYNYVFDWEYWIRFSEKYPFVMVDRFWSCFRFYNEAKSQAQDHIKYDETYRIMVQSDHEEAHLYLWDQYMMIDRMRALSLVLKELVAHPGTYRYWVYAADHFLPKPVARVLQKMVTPLKNAYRRISV